MNRSSRTFILRRQRRRFGRYHTPSRNLIASIIGIALLVVVGSTAAGAATAAAVAGGVYYYFTRDLPDPTAIVTEQESFETVKIYDRTGEHLLYESIDPRPFRGDRTYVALAEISPHLINATVALEDRSFWDNPGVNLRGLARALIQNIQGGGVQGASSITQQLIKNVLIDPELRYQRSYTRKIKEALTALEITRHYSKEQILEWYLNNNFYGNFSYGIESAAHVYFDKPASDLNLSEAAMLAALPQYPGLNPFQAPADAKRRQGKVLQAMADAGYITQAEADAAFAQELKVRESALEKFENDTAPHFALAVLDELKNRYNTPEDPYYIWRNGLIVRTTLDVNMQHEVTCIARQRIAHVNNQNPTLPGCTKLEPAAGLKVRKEGDPPVSNAAAVVMRTDTGEILAMLGSLDYNNKDIDGEVNIALAERQPGSAFKPITYATGFSQGLTAATVVMDVRQVFPDAVE
ncbi:MAG: transglycosylase domain-containing protein, partial [Caldilineales bacterium]|nr:transglycosylase domain-containing protein [Caldilineales bacterium]